MPSPSTQTEKDRKYLALALGSRTLSDDPKAVVVPQSGVVSIIVKQDEIVSISANVLPPSLKSKFSSHKLTVDESLRYHVIEHAERASIFGALLRHIDLKGSTLYCSRFPCSDCARAIIWVGIKRVVTPSGFTNEKRWLSSQQTALRMMRSVGITVRYVDMQTDR